MTTDNETQAQDRSMSRRTFVKGVGAAAAIGVAGGGLAGFGIGRATASDADTATTTGGTTSTKPFKVGGAYPMTGLYAASGKEQKEGLLVGVDEWNKRGGVLGRQIEVVLEDCQDMAAEVMVSNFRTLTEKEQVDVIINGYLFYSGPEYDIVADSGTPYLHDNTTWQSVDKYLSDPEKYWMIFMSDPSQLWYGNTFPVMIQSLQDSGDFTPKDKTVSIVMASDPYSNDIAERVEVQLKEVGWTLLMKEKIVSPLSEWGPVIEKLHQQPPDALFFCDVILADTAAFVKQFAANPTKSLVYCQYAPTLDEYIALVGDAGNDILTASVQGNTPSPILSHFSKLYQDKWGRPPGMGLAGSMYDELNMYLTALVRTGQFDDKRLICQAMIDFPYMGTQGVFAVTEKHDIMSYPAETSNPYAGLPCLYFQWQNQERKIVWPYNFATAPFQLPRWV